MSNREFIHDIVLQVAVLVAFFAIMGAITSWNCARCDAALRGEAVSRPLQDKDATTSLTSGQETASPLLTEAAK